jgi:hypothetical protein
MLCNFSICCKLYTEISNLIFIIYYRVVVEMEIRFFGVFWGSQLACFRSSYQRYKIMLYATIIQQQLSLEQGSVHVVT